MANESEGPRLVYKEQKTSVNPIEQSDEDDEVRGKERLGERFLSPYGFKMYARFVRDSLLGGK